MASIGRERIDSGNNMEHDMLEKKKISKCKNTASCNSQIA